MASNGVTRPPALDVTMQEILDALKAVSFRPQVIDNLTSQDTGAPLSANQGRVLKDAIDDLVTQSITDGDTSHAPSGDAVHDALNAIRSNTAIAEWQSGYTYAIGDYCMHNGYLYRSITNGSHVGWHDEYFEIVTLKSISTQVGNVTGILDAQLHMPMSWRSYSNMLDAIKANWATITANSRFFSANVMLSGGAPFFILAQKASDYEDVWYVITIYNDGEIKIYFGTSQTISLIRTI